MSKMYDKIKSDYDSGLWSEVRVRNMVVKGVITEEEYQEYLKELEIIDIQKQRADIDYIALMSGIDLEV